MSFFYGAAQPLNIKSTGYKPYDQVDFLHKATTGRSIKSGSFRLTGKIKVTKQVVGNNNFQSVVPEDQVFLDAYAGVSGILKNCSTEINNKIIESVAYLNRHTAMMTQANNTLEQLTSNSANAVELKGLQNNIPLSYSEDLKGANFSILLNTAINKSSTDLPASKFSLIKLSFTLAGALEALYSTKTPYDITTAGTITALDYTINDLELHWYETMETGPIERTIFRTTFLTTTSVVSTNSTLNIRSPQLYDSVSMSFIQQQDRNLVYRNDCYSCYYPSLQTIEILCNGVDSPIRYVIGSGNSPVYQDIALNYLKSLDGNMECNSICNKLLSETLTFGIGCKFSTSINDTVVFVLSMVPDSTYQPSENPFDAYIYTGGFIEI